MGDMAWFCWAHSAHNEDLSSTPSHRVGWLTGSQPHAVPDPRRLLIPLISKDTYTTVYKPTQRHTRHIMKNNQNFKEMLGEIYGCLCLWLRNHIVAPLHATMSKSHCIRGRGMRPCLLMEEYQNIPPWNLKQLTVAYETAHCLDYSSDIGIADIRALIILLDWGRKMDWEVQDCWAVCLASTH